MCIAGPGTGKTKSLLRRVPFLITEKNASVDEICYLTFIQQIKKAFRHDFEIGDETRSLDPPQIKTLHSLACRIIRNLGHTINLRDGLYFLNAAAREDVASKLFRRDFIEYLEDPLVKTDTSARKTIESVKKMWQDDEDPCNEMNPSHNISNRLVLLSNVYHALDWDHVVRLASSLIGDHPELRWLRRIKHWMVDEYQDFNKAEQALLDSLVTPSDSVVIVGDDYQSLYKSRGGSPDGLRRRYGDAANNDTVTLVNCGRCPSEILAKANRFAECMEGDLRTLHPTRSGGRVECRGFDNAKKEVEALSEYLRHQIDSLGEDSNAEERTACLFPSHRMLDHYYEKLLRMGVTCLKRPSPTIDRQILGIALRLSKEPGQIFAERVLFERAFSGKPRKRKSIIRRIWETGTPITEFLPELLQVPEFQMVRVDCENWLSAISGIVSGDASAMASALCQLTGLAISAEQMQCFLDSSEEENQEDAIEKLCNAVTENSEEILGAERSIDFLTIHESKGLSRRCIVLPGLEQLHFPGTSVAEELEEKKRMFYVALTRATHEVLITYPRCRHRGDPLRRPGVGRCKPSQFVSLAGVSCTRN